MKFRIAMMVLLWAVAFALALNNFLERRHKPRLDVMASSNGLVSSIQFETWFHSPQPVAPGDRIIAINGRPFSRGAVEEVLNTRQSGEKVVLKVQREDQTFDAVTYLKRHSKQTIFTLFVVPALLSAVFLIFALGVLLQRGVVRVNRESVEVFSALCFSISLIFLSLFPGLNISSDLSQAFGIPIASALLIHLFLVYPKKKIARNLRLSLVGLSYGFCLLLGIMRVWSWQDERWRVLHSLNLPLLVLASVISMIALGNTLLTSKDFWARRRARLLSLVFLVTFIGMLGAFVAFLWKDPSLSIERILALSLFFPTMFLVIFLKSNVFDLERIFRRGLHQFSLVSVAIILALLLGVGWSEWGRSTREDWTLWVAIAVGVMLLARPVADRIENAVHSWIKTKVKYPQVNRLFETHGRLETFLTSFFSACEKDLAMRDIVVRFFSDPLQRWTSENEQRWVFSEGKSVRVTYNPSPRSQGSVLSRGDVSIGELQFEGGDALAFDPALSREWQEVLKSLSRCLEILALREFVGLQQGFLAVGRMQALLAHELKNPLAIIKVCSGLLSSRFRGDDEADELLGTIEQEVTRISKALQGVFQQSDSVGQRERVSLREILAEIRAQANGRFPKRSLVFDIAPSAENMELWSERESLKQALLNLVVNAFEAGSPWVEIKALRDRGVMRFIVRDEGGGLPDHVDIFKPFVTTKPSGTGLGLAQVKAFVDRHSGVIRVENQLKGARFTLEFPDSFVFSRKEA